MSKLVPCRSIHGLKLKRDDSLRTLVIENQQDLLAVAFTPIEYRLILALLQQETIPDQQLIYAIGVKVPVDAQIKKNLEKHIENMKSKLRATGLLIRRVHQYGYSLVPESTQAQAVETTGL